MKQTKGGKSATQESQPPAETTSAVGSAIDWSQAPVTGFENTNSSDLGIPFLVILQKGSPEVDKAHPNYAQRAIEGAEVGDIVNTLSREVVYKYKPVKDEPVHIIPTFHQKSYVEWKPRDSGGGLVANHKDEMILSRTKRNDKGQDVLSNGNLVVTTSYVFATMLADDPKKIVLSFTSTQLKKARQWLNLMMGLKIGQGSERRQLPMFSHIYAVSTVPESNQKGSWFGWKIELVEMVKDRALVQDSIDFAKQIASGSVRAALPPIDGDEIPTEDQSAGKY
jgi:hypothetical protein